MPAIPIADFETRVLRRCEARGRARKTTNQIKQVLRELASVGVLQTSDLTEQAIENWLIAWPDRTPVTFKSHLRCLSSLCTMMKKNDWVAVDPFAEDSAASWMRDDARPSPPRRRYAKSRDDVRGILAQSRRDARNGSWDAWRDMVLAHLVFLTGARVGELLRLEFADVDQCAKTMTIHAKWITDSRGKKVWWRPKTEGAADLVAIGDELLGMILLWQVRVCRPYRRQMRTCPWILPGKKLLGPWIGGGPGRSPLDRIKALGQRAGVPNTCCKAGRKGIGTHRDIGLTPQGRRELFRHSDDATGDFYDERDVEARRADAIKIERFYLLGT